MEITGPGWRILGGVSLAMAASVAVELAVTVGFVSIGADHVGAVATLTIVLAFGGGLLLSPEIAMTFGYGATVVAGFGFVLGLALDLILSLYRMASGQEVAFVVGHAHAFALLIATAFLVRALVIIARLQRRVRLGTRIALHSQDTLHMLGHPMINFIFGLSNVLAMILVIFPELAAVIAAAIKAPFIGR